MTLLGDLGPWGDRIYLAGGLAPRYLVGQLPEGARAHIGTTDIDLAPLDRRNLHGAVIFSGCDTGLFYLVVERVLERAPCAREGVLVGDLRG